MHFTAAVVFLSALCGAWGNAIEDDSALDVEQRSKKSNLAARMMYEEVERLEAENAAYENSIKQMSEIQIKLEADLSSAHTDRTDMEKEIATLNVQIEQQKNITIQIATSLRVMLNDTNVLLDECNKSVAAGKLLIENDSMCPGFADTFKCENHGLCRVRVNSFDHRVEPYCHCRRGFHGRTCSNKGEANSSCADAYCENKSGEAGCALPKTVCEHQNLEIDCSKKFNGKGKIHIIKALYGRTDTTTCSAGRSAAEVKKTDCISKAFTEKFTNVIRQKCESKKYCKVVMDNKLAGDPCLSTFKFSKVEWFCVNSP